MNPQITQISQTHDKKAREANCAVLTLYLCNLRNLWVVFLSSSRQWAIGNRQFFAPSILISGFLFLICFPAWGSGSPQKSSALEGKLLATAPGGPFLATAGKQVRLTAKLSFLLHTLEDKRLEDREVRLEGAVEPDGAFEVDRLFTVKDGKLFKVRYYCEICNIAAVEPGNCVCCQRPTELQEIPVSEVTKDTVTVP